MGDATYTRRRRVMVVRPADAETEEPTGAPDEGLEYEPYIEDAEEQPTEQGLTASRKMALGIGVLLVFAVFGLAIWLLSSRNTAEADASSPPGQGVGPNVGAFAPDFELVDVRTNQPLKLSSLRGKPVFINFWGTWCPPCRYEMPEMQKFYDKHKGQVELLGISMGPRDDPAGVKAFVDAANYSWTFIHDADYAVATQYQVFSVPSSYFIDRDGVVRGVKIGAFLDNTEIEAYLEQAR